MGPKEEPKKKDAAKKKRIGRRRNFVLGGSGIMRFPHSRMYARKAIYKFKKTGQKKAALKEKKPPKFASKKIGGDKNGGERVVFAKKTPRYLPTESPAKRLSSYKTAFCKHKHSLRPSITPGTLLILVAGRHKGKRVVFLKQLSSGLLLVTGPYHLNGCPLRRINQIYVMATRTKLNIKRVNVPDHLNDEYFRRKKLKKPKHTEGEIFDTKKEVYRVSEDRKKDQVDVDRQVLEAVRQNPDRKFMFGYLGANFFLRNHQYPHKMVF